jgi:hypothetical protein
MKLLLPVLTAVLLVVFVSAHASPSAAGKSDAGILLQFEADFMKAAAKRGSQGYMSYYAEDAAELPNGADMFRGEESIAKTMGFLDDKQPPDMDAGLRGPGGLGRLGLYVRNL